MQNSWGNRWGANGFVHLAIENGVGISAMNLYVQFMDVEDGFPEKKEPLVPNCDVDEGKNPRGVHRC